MTSFRYGRSDSAAATRSFKVVVFTPEAEREAVSSAAFTAGAGRIGAYEECSFAIPGEGTFFGTDPANPTVGERGRRETVRELRLEFVCPARKLAAVLASIRTIIPTKSPRSTFIRSTRSNRRRPASRGRPDRPIGRAEDVRGFCCQVDSGACGHCRGDGGRSESAGRACSRRMRGRRRFPHGRRPRRRRRTFDRRVRFHRGFEAETLGIGLLVAGHYATERPGVEDLAEKIPWAFPELIVWPSRAERDPIRMSSDA